MILPQLSSNTSNNVLTEVWDWFFYCNSLPIADFGMASHNDWKSVFFKVGHWRRYVLSAAYNSLYGQALMAGLTNSRIPNTFISASAEKGNDGQISSSQITLAKQHTEGHRNVLSFMSL